MTDKEKIGKLEHENIHLKMHIKFLTDYSRALQGFVLEDIKIRSEQAEKEFQKLKETMSATK